MGFEVIWRDNEVVGFIRRGEFGYVIGKSLVYGYVRDFSGKFVIIEFLKIGKYIIEFMGELFFVKIYLKVFFDLKNFRV